MKNYVDAEKLQEYTTKLVAKLKEIFPGPAQAASTMAEMTDESKVYVYTGSETGYTAGNWYYWNGTAWTSGGVYNAVQIETDTTLTETGEAADAKATGDAIAAAKAAVLADLAPAYSTSATYAVGAYVVYNGGLYRCITAISTAEAWTAAHWTAVDLANDVGASLADLKSAIYESQTITESGTNIIIDDGGTTANLTSDTQSLEVTHTGKNLLVYPFYGTTKTVNDLTFTVNSDGTINVTGTASANTSYAIVAESSSLRQPIHAGTYTLSGCPARSAADNFDLFVNGAGFSGNISDTGNGASFTLATDTTFYMKFYVGNGQTMNHTIRPMIESGTVKTDWEKYKSETITLSDGAATATLYDGVNHFTASSAFAVSYTKNLIKKDTLNIKDFGAVGDGETDDTAAIQMAFTVGAGKHIYIPSGTYLFSGTLAIPSNTHIYGDGDTSVFQLANTFALTPYSWRPNDDNPSALYRYPMLYLADTTTDCAVENIKIVGQSATFKDENEDALAVLGAGHKINGVITDKINYFPSSFASRTCITPGIGIMIFKAQNISVCNCRVTDSGYEGIGTELCEDVVISGCFVGDTNQTGVQIHRSSKRVRVTSCSVDYTANASAGSALTLHAWTDVPMSDIWMVDNYLCKGITLIGGGENDCYLINNTIHDGAFTRNGTIYRKNWVISGNRFDNGGIVNQIDYCVIVNNLLNVNSGYQMINMRGNNVVADNNVPLGSVSGVYIETHET